VLILDEPTSGLDPNQIVEIRQVIKQLSQEKTVLLSTHIMQEVEAICQQVVIINKGQVVANQSLAELQQLQQRPGLRVSFSDVLEAEWLLRLPAVEQAERIDRLSWQVTAADTQAASQQLLQMAAEANVRITSLQEGASLEDLFRQLTTQVEQVVK
jgi:ABC-2 type transport system ATP-binding protein